MKQTQLWKNPKLFHGGAQAQGRRKTARTIVTKRPMHVIFRSSRARGKWSFQLHAKKIRQALDTLARKYHVRIRLYENVGNHLHLATQAATREEFRNFLREVPQAIAFLVTGTRKGRPLGRFWDGLVYTRVVQWGRAWAGIHTYFEKNRLEASGFPREIAQRIARELRAAWG